MGVERGLVCRKCNEWIYLHKCRQTESITQLREPPHFNVSWPEIETYWGARALWFTWRHRDHGGELAWIADTDDYYWSHEHTEVAKHREKGSTNDDPRFG